MLRDLGSFLAAVYSHWVNLVSGIAGVALTILALAMNAPPWWFWPAAVICLVVASFRVWRDEHRERCAANRRLAPVLEIAPVPVIGEHGRSRILVRNLSELPIRFSARLEAIAPIQGLMVRAPSHLQITGTPEPHRESEIPGNGTAYVDVCQESSNGPIGMLGILSAEHPAREITIPRQRYELTISVSPSLPSTGPTARRRFFIIPQGDCGMTFSDAG